MRILVVDDDEMIRELIRELLTGPGREIHEAESCARAFELIYAHRYDIVTLDLNLPDGCGLDVLEGIRKDGSCTLAIVVSGDVCNTVHIKRAQSLGVHALLEKPFDCAELRSLIFGWAGSNTP